MTDAIRFEPLVGATLDRIGVKITTSVPAIATPFPSWNSLCGEEGGRTGIAQTWTVVVGGADGSGKSYLAINLAAHAVTLGHKVGFCNFEMTETGLTQRYLAILSGVPKYRIEHGEYFSMKAWAHAQSVADEIYRESGGCLITNASPIHSIEDIVTAYQKLADAGCDMVCIDYAQLVKTNSQGLFQRSEEVSNTVRALGHEYSTVNIILSQLNREGKKIVDDPPTRHHLLGGTWENDANQIVLIDHTYKIRRREQDRIYTRLILDKNRHGEAPVKIPVSWDLRSMRWDEEAMVTDEEGQSTVVVEAAQVDPNPQPTLPFMEA
jgi:replicative DNA helicase